MYHLCMYIFSEKTSFIIYLGSGRRWLDLSWGLEWKDRYWPELRGVLGYGVWAYGLRCRGLGRALLTAGCESRFKRNATWPRGLEISRAHGFRASRVRGGKASRVWGLRVRSSSSRGSGGLLGMYNVHLSMKVKL